MHGLGTHTAELEKEDVIAILKVSYSVVKLCTYLTGLIAILGESLDL
jgi:hypothetical protein